MKKNFLLIQQTRRLLLGLIGHTSARLLLVFCLWGGLAGNAIGQACINANGNFSNGLTGWFSWKATNTTANFAVENGELAITNISASGNYDWITVNSQGLSLVQGRSYIITFDARSTTSRPITVGPRRGGPTNYAAYTLRDYIIGTSMQTYQIVYKHLDATDNGAQIMFYLGATNHAVYIDNICIKEGTVPNNGVSLNILPVGNSISQGLFYAAGTYRKMLYYELTALGYNINMVGSNEAYANPNGTGPYGGAPDPDLGWDQDHECYWGYTVSQVTTELNLAETVPAWDAVPDVLLLHLGTNNLSSGASGLSNIVAKVRQVNPNVTIFLAQLVNAKSGAHASLIPGYNSQVATLATSLNTAQSPVILVNQYTTLDVNNPADWADNLHPSKGGAAKMAKVWLNAINAKFAPPTTPLTGVSIIPSSLSLKVGQASFVNPVFQPADATNQTVTWSSLNPSVASIDPVTRRVAALAVGTTQISVTTAVTASDPTPFVSTITVTVTPADQNPTPDPTFDAPPAHFRTTRAYPLISLGAVIDVPVSAYGGYPNDGLDDRIAIQAAIDYAKTVSPSRVVFEPGTYDMKTFRTEASGYDQWLYNRHAIHIMAGSNIELDGNNTTILIHNPKRGFVRMQDSENIIVRDLTIDYATLPFTQGKITARDNSSVTVKIDAGFPLPNAPHFNDASDYPSISSYNWAMLKSSDKSGALKPGAPNLYENLGFTQVGAAADSTFKFNVAANSWHSSATAVDDYWVFQARYNEHNVFDCVLGKNITYLNNKVYSSPASAFTGTDNHEINIINCEVRIKPGSGRVNSIDADVVHINGSQIGPWVQGCYFEAFADDAVNLKHSARAILGVPAADQLKLQYDVTLGETLEIYIPGTGTYLGEFTINQIVSVTGNDFTVRLDRAHGVSASQVVSPTGYDRTGARAYLTSRSCESFIFRNNTFKNHRGWGMILQAKFGEVKGNTFDRSSSGGVKFDNIANWTEGFLASDVVVEGNTFTCTAIDNESIQGDDHAAIVAIITKTQTGCSPSATFCPGESINTFQGLKNITIKNNHIGYVKTGVQIENVNLLTYSGNTFSLCSASPFTGTPVAEIFVNNTLVNTGPPVLVTGVTMTPPTASLVVGGTQQLTATIAPINASNQSVTWASSNTAVATVNATGLVTAVAIGTVTMTVTTVDQQKTATSTITVAIGQSLTDDIVSVSGPTSVTQGATVNVSVGYSASTSRDIWVVFQEAVSPYTWYGSRITTVPQGTGTLNVSIATTTAAPLAASNYQYSAFITPVGGDWATRFDNLPQANISVVSSTPPPAAGDTLYLMQNGVVTAKYNVTTGVDSVIFYRPNTNSGGSGDGTSGQAVPYFDLTGVAQYTGANTSLTSAWYQPYGGGIPVQYIYNSPTAGTHVGLDVVLPPSYSTNPTKKYPIIFWLHGHGETQSGIRNGVDSKFYNGMVNGEFPEAILVSVGGPTQCWWSDEFDGDVKAESHIINEVLSFCDQKFRTLGKKEGRAIMGFSMGGFGATKIALKYPQYFAAVGSWCGALYSPGAAGVGGQSFGYPGNYTTIWNNNTALYANDCARALLPSTAAQVKAQNLKIFIHKNNTDIFIPHNDAFVAELISQGITPVYSNSSGGHESSNITGAFFNSMLSSMATQ